MLQIDNASYVIHILRDTSSEIQRGSANSCCRGVRNSLEAGSMKNINIYIKHVINV